MQFIFPQDYPPRGVLLHGGTSSNFSNDFFSNQSIPAMSYLLSSLKNFATPSS